MRNLKRALSLTLASVMLLGMMVIGTSAASYPDVTEEHNVEAIEVLQAVGVMSGSDSGNFNPDQAVSRIEMAVVMSNLLNLKVDYFEGQCSFTDVPEWAGKYVAACENYGIVSGVGGGRFGVSDVTATQAALMMLKALGYFQYASDFGSNWAQETAKQAANLELFKGIDAVDNTVLTRNQVAQLALNTLKTPVVVPETNTPDITVGSGETAVTINGKVSYKVTASSDAYARAISSVEGSDQSTVNGIQGWVIELGEKLYSGKLQLRENGKGGAVVYDAFGRPARRWQYDGTTFGTYPKTEELRQEYTTKVTGKDLYDLLGADLIRQYNFNITIDGENDRTILDKDHNNDGALETEYYFTENSIVRTNTWAVGGTGNGVLTQVYVDSVEHEVNIAIINTYLAKAAQDYNSRDNDVDLTVYKIDDHNNNPLNPAYVKCDSDGTADSHQTETLTLKGEDFDIEDVKEGDLFLVNVAEGEVKILSTPEVVSEITLNSFKRGDWVKNDDVQYDYASTACYDSEVLDEYDQSNMQSVTYNAILDQYGYLIGLELNEELNQYLFLTGVDLGNSNLSAQNATANVIFLDGTMSTVTVNVAKSERASNPSVNGETKGYTITGGNDRFDQLTSGDGWSQVNTWCTYTVDANGIYTLKVVGNNSTARDDGVSGAKKIAQSVMSVTNDGTNEGIENSPASTVALDGSKLEISGKQTRLNGSKAKNATQNGDFSFVYGNDETVYINATLKKVTPKSGDTSKERAIVDKVDSVVTGIKNVDISVSDLKNNDGKDLQGVILPGGTTTTDDIANEVYVLYKNDGYVIGVVTLGAEDNGSSNSYAYIIGDVKQEDLVGTNQWRWSKEAIIDGKLVTLYEVSDGQDILSNSTTVKGNWYNLRFDKDGNVSSIRQETGTDYIKFDATTVVADQEVDAYDKFVTRVEDVYPATMGLGSFGSRNDTVLLYADYRCDNTTVHPNSANDVRELMFEQGTLYTDRRANNNRGDGIQIDPAANIVVLLSETHGDGRAFNTKTDGFVGWTGMKDALKELQSETSDGWTRFDGILTAVFRNGIATSVILDCRSGKGNQKPTEPVVPMQVNVTVVDDDNNETILTTSISWENENTIINLVSALVPDYEWVSGGDSYSFREGGTGSVTLRYSKKAVTEKKNIVVLYCTDVSNASTAVNENDVVISVELSPTTGLYTLRANHPDILENVPDNFRIADSQPNLPAVISKNSDSLVLVQVTTDKAGELVDTQPDSPEAIKAILGQGNENAANAASVVKYTATQNDAGTEMTLSLTGDVKSAASAGTEECKAAMTLFSPNNGEDTTAFENLYDLKTGTWGFVLVMIDDDHGFWLLVGEAKDSRTHPWKAGEDYSGEVLGGDWGIVLRHDGETDDSGANGAVKFVTEWTTKVGGVSYTINVNDLVLPKAPTTPTE